MGLDDVSYDGPSTCPICGVGCGSGGFRRHRCNEKTLRGIDAVHSRSDADCTVIRKPGFTERLKDGFAMLFGEYD
jgi:hypothetical protein